MRNKQKVISGNNYVRLADPPLDTEKPLGDINNYNLLSLQNYE